MSSLCGKVVKGSDAVTRPVHRRHK